MTTQCNMAENNIDNFTSRKQKDINANYYKLQCFDTVGWATGRASCL